MAEAVGETAMYCITRGLRADGATDIVSKGIAYPMPKSTGQQQSVAGGGGHCSGDEERRGALSYLGRHYPRHYSDENRCVSHAGGIYRKARWKGDASRRLGRRSHRGRLARVLLHVRRSTSSRGAVICQQETAEGPTGNPTHDWCTLLRGSSLLDGGHSA